MEILLIGLSHKTAPVELRERLAFNNATLKSALTHFDSHHSEAQLNSVNEGVILSTCNRLEVYTRVRDPAAAEAAIVRFLGRACAIAPAEFREHLYHKEGEAAVLHLFRVAAGLDSMVLGEPQILGQITDAYGAALSQGSAGTVLSALFRAAIHAGKRARTETAIGVNPASISSVAAAVATDLLGDLGGQQVLLVGTGQMGEIVVKALLNRGVHNITVVNRTYESALTLAQQFGGRALGFQQMIEALSGADIVITSTGAPHIILDRELVEPAMASRPARPLFIIDIAVPRDVDPDVTDLPNIHLRDIDDLQTKVEGNTHERQLEIPRVEQIVAEETTIFMEWLSSLEVVSTITALRQHIEELRQRELEWLFKRLDADEDTRRQIEHMSHRLINKIMHQPTMRLKQKAINGSGPAFTSTTRYLFGLDKTENGAKKA